ncbi:hypothetical protein E6O75_ATG02222 [Venturia nashicola]|uniref:Uncharacterized protein n=1 Tax=Venturia nashicola TaxID=86259 RepID=A0A4Z1P5Z0_9PEZI|nr:hypothetical protein E6O75_ATG02222 [Venturia nashicola]
MTTLDVPSKAGCRRAYARVEISNRMVKATYFMLKLEKDGERCSRYSCHGYIFDISTRLTIDSRIGRIICGDNDAFVTHRLFEDLRGTVTTVHMGFSISRPCVTGMSMSINPGCVYSWERLWNLHCGICPPNLEEVRRAPNQLEASRGPRVSWSAGLNIYPRPDPLLFNVETAGMTMTQQFCLKASNPLSPKCISKVHVQSAYPKCI